jgi:hypothetical protein
MSDTAVCHELRLYSLRRRETIREMNEPPSSLAIRCCSQPTILVRLLQSVFEYLATTDDQIEMLSLTAQRSDP